MYLSDENDYTKYENNLDSYIYSHISERLNYRILKNAFVTLKSRPDRSKLMALLVDLQTTHVFMTIDSHRMFGIWNNKLAKYFSSEKQDISVLDDPNLFLTKMDVLNSGNAFVMRARAFWDKYMGVMTLYLQADKYEKYVKNKSRRKYFMKNVMAECESVPFPFQHALVADLQSKPYLFVSVVDKLYAEGIFPDPFIELFFYPIDRLDKYRTAEAHGAGLLRKFSLSMLPLEDSYDIGIAQNCLIASNRMMRALADELSKKYPETDYRTLPRYLNPDKYA